MRKGVQKMRKIKSFMAVLLSLVMMGTMPGAVSSITAYGAQTSESEDTATLAASSGLGVESHTQEEIINHIKDSGALITDDTVYKTDYSAEQPYSAGVLDESTLNSGIAMLNNIRYIAGLNYDVALDDGFNEECQAGALINKINGSISHYPQQPSDMSDEMYQLAYKGCNESNIAWGYSTLNKCIVFGWMSDDDDGNISRVGHRAWCLNPTMGKTGFGVVDNYYNMHSFDGSHTSSVKNISWPAQNMPVEYFEKNMPWSIFTGSSETASDVKVTLTRQSDGKVWNFSQNSADGYFNCTNYIQNGTIVFRPGDITGYNDGDVFTVSVTGVKTPLSYTVSFFSLGSELGHVHSFGKSNFVVTSVDIDAMTLEGTMACDSCGQKFYSTEGTITNLLTSNVTCGFKGYIQFDFTAKLYGLNWQGTNFYYINGLPHKYGEVEFTWDGTDCTADAKCSRCGDVVSKKCTVTSKTTATCTSDGVTIYTAECDGKTDTKTVDTPATGHLFTDYESNGDATCQADGTKTAKCDYGCGATDTIADKGSKLDHKFTKYVSNDDATCMTDGTKTAKCDYGCGEEDTITDEGSKLDHKFTKYVSNDDATCMTDGTKTAKCDYGCGEEDTITDEGSKLDHKFTKYIPNNDATCKNVGTKTAECDYGCGTTDTIENADDPQKEHSFTKHISDNNATCQADGTKTAKCDYDCGTTDTIADKGSKLDHKFTKYVSNNDATCTADGTKTAECDYGCGATDTVNNADDPRREHTSSDKWVVSAKATDKADGILVDKCTECGQIIDSKRVPQIENVKLAYTSCTYNGTAKKPEVTVYDVDGNILNKTNYTVSYKNNTASGAASVIVTFKGNYAGRITATFVIYPKAVSIKTAQSTAKGVKLTWNRAANGTGYIVYRSVNGSSFKKYKTINSLSTISMVDSGAKKSGTKYAYKIYVYKSVNGKVYNSAASAVKLTYYMAAPAWKSLKNSSARAITVKYGKTSGATGYQIQYAAAKTFKGAKTLNIAGAKNVTKTVKGLAKNKRYYVRVRSYRKSGKVTYYSAWSTAKNVVIKK